MARQDIADAVDCVLSVLDSPEHWTRGGYARSQEGEVLDDGWDSSDAYSFCLLGAYEKCSNDERGGKPVWDAPAGVKEKWWGFKDTLERELYQLKGAFSIVSFNDHPERTYADVRSVLEKVKAYALAS